MARGRGRLGRQLPVGAAGLHVHPAAAGRCAAVRLARRDPYAGDRGAGGLLRQRLLREQHPRPELPLRAARKPLPGALRALRAWHAGAGDRRAGGHAFIAKRSQDAIEPYRPSSRARRRRPLLQARRLHGRHADERRQPAAGDREDPDLPARASATTSGSCGTSTSADFRSRWCSSRSSCSAPRSCRCCAARWRRAARRACRRTDPRQPRQSKYGDGEARQARPEPEPWRQPHRRHSVPGRGALAGIIG